MSSKPPNPYTTELQTALRAVHLASLLTKSHLLNHLSSKTPSDVTASTKSDDSEVTTADFASQAVIISVLHAAFPGDVFIAEESGEMLRGDGVESKELRRRVWELVGKVGEVERRYAGEGVDADVKLPESVEEMIEIIDLGQVGGRGKAISQETGTPTTTRRTWILDPIDGTKTYIRGQQYVVCLCLVEHGEQQVAVFGCPNLSMEERDADGRVRIEEGLVDLRGDGGWIASCVKGGGVGLSRMARPWEVKGLEEVVVWDGGDDDFSNTQMDGEVGVVSDGTLDGEANNDTTPITIRFTDSAASPHISKDLHQKIFQHFAAGNPTSASPVIPLDIWSMQLKYVLLTLRASGADALIRTPPTSAYHASVWDHAGGQLLLRESGGILTDAEGVEFLLDGGTRKLVGNWGVCAVRGGGWRGRDGGRLRGKEVHEILARWVGRMVRERDEARRREGGTV